ncbi:MAG: DUF1501 domain-containing protein [Gemmatimonadetes bacterium]|nr:DUF1501 domain-containing protein [Gemmatimonadota bacterium]
MDRRDFLRCMCYGGVATFANPVVHFAQVPERGRFVFVLLRGGFDGLAAIVPFGDAGYQSIRGSMAFESSKLTALTDGFGLAPGLAPLRAFWDRDELVALHALAIPYRTRSHFDGQAVLETGLSGPDGSADGWLNRLLQVMEGQRSGIAVAAGMPRSMTGPHPVATWSPAQLGMVEDSYLDRLHLLYRSDPTLYNRFEAAVAQREITSDMGATGSAGAARARAGVEPILRAAARFLRQPDGPNIAAVEFSGWDTHANQGMEGGPLDRLLGQLAQGLTVFRDEMGDVWSQTTVVAMTEFGRTARPNGTRGTDHGTAGAGFILGPNVARSALVTDWPGLRDSQLFDNRDLRPTLDTRAVLKGVIAGTFDLTHAQAERVFPNSSDAPGRYDLMA